MLPKINLISPLKRKNYISYIVISFLLSEFHGLHDSQVVGNSVKVFLLMRSFRLIFLYFAWHLLQINRMSASLVLQFGQIGCFFIVLHQPYKQLP